MDLPDPSSPPQLSTPTVQPTIPTNPTTKRSKQQPKPILKDNSPTGLIKKKKSVKFILPNEQQTKSKKLPPKKTSRSGRAINLPQRFS